MFQRKIIEKIKTHILWQNKRFFGKSCWLKDNVEKYCSHCKVWLGAEELLIKDHRLHKCPTGPLWMFEYDACRQAVSEQPCTDITLPTVQPHLFDCWQALSEFIQTVTRWHVWQTSDLYIGVWLADLINLGRADMVTSLICIKRLLDQPSRYLEVDGRHKGSVAVVRINNC